MYQVSAMCSTDKTGNYINPTYPGAIVSTGKFQAETLEQAVSMAQDEASRAYSAGATVLNEFGAMVYHFRRTMAS